MWLRSELKTVEEITFGNNKMRLVESEKGNQYIQTWSSLSKDWSTMYRYNIEESWESWKKLAKRLKNRK